MIVDDYQVVAHPTERNRVTVTVYMKTAVPAPGWGQLAVGRRHDIDVSKCADQRQFNRMIETIARDIIQDAHLRNERVEWLKQINRFDINVKDLEPQPVSEDD